VAVVTGCAQVESFKICRASDSVHSDGGLLRKESSAVSESAIANATKESNAMVGTPTKRVQPTLLATPA
jgi:hypothetical protein